MVSLTVTGVSVSIDGFFLGQSSGDLGLGAVNLSWPILMVSVALSLCIGIGGSINLSIFRGMGEEHKVHQVFLHTLGLLLLSGAVMGALFYFLAGPLLTALGATGEIHELAKIYVQTLCLGMCFQVIVQGAARILRNFDEPMMAMGVMIGNFILDTAMSGYFTYYLGWGVFGAAFAGVISQVVAFFPIVYLLFRHRPSPLRHEFNWNGDLVLDILKVGASPAAMTILPGITVLVLNVQALDYGGVIGIATYAVANYALAFGSLSIEGVSEGAQPLISYAYGERNKKEEIFFTKWMFITNIGLGFIMMGLLLWATPLLTYIFNISPEVEEELMNAMLLYTPWIPCMGIVRAMTSYFYAVKANRQAAVMVYGESLVALPICAILLPLYVGLSGVWLTELVTQVAMVFVGLYMLRTYRHNYDALEEV